MDNMDFYSKALAYHTKGRKAILEQTELEEKKCSCCDADPCNCDDHVQVHVEGADEVNDKNKNSLLDKDENEPVDNTVDMTNKIIKGQKPYDKNIEPIYKEVSGNVSEGALAGAIRNVRKMKMDGDSKEEAHKKAKAMGIHPKIVDDHYDNDWKPSTANEEFTEQDFELVEMWQELTEMLNELSEMFEERELDLEEAFETLDIEEDELEENFGNLSRTKRLIAAKKAAMTKRRTGNFGGGRPKKVRKASELKKPKFK